MNTHRIHQRFSLQATERLRLRKQIETLFQSGEAFSLFPFRVVYRFVAREPVEVSPVRVGFVVPKKRIRKAVHRNRIRRLAKEAWRLQKHDLYAAMPENRQLHCFLIFTGKEPFTFPDAEKAVAGLLKKLARLASELEPDQPDV